MTGDIRPSLDLERGATGRVTSIDGPLEGAADSTTRTRDLGIQESGSQVSNVESQAPTRSSALGTDSLTPDDTSTPRAAPSA